MDPSAINDPFADRDDQTRTVIKPDPRGRGARDAAARDERHRRRCPGSAIPDVGLNPLVALANRLLLLVPQLRATRQVADPAALAHLARPGHPRLRRARRRARHRAGARDGGALRALHDARRGRGRHALGRLGRLGRHSLLAMFHNETWGGEKVFQLMAKLAEKPAENRDLLELIYAALALGFEGRYRVIENGRAQLDAVRDRLAQILKQQRGDYSHALAAALAGPARSSAGDAELAAAVGDGRRWPRCCCVGTYLGAVARRSNRARTRSSARSRGCACTPPVVAAPQPAPKPRLAQFLQPEIKAGLVARAATRSIAASSRSAATASSPPAARRCCRSARR